ncbi:MAG: ATP-dependent DNA helicase [Oscillospiraceae bacterium]|nr:ATP-dependent DNA helicase [Oscillospiraceae bacterium]
MTKQTIIRKIPRKLPVQSNDNETPVFIAHGCILLEYQEGDRFNYRAVNLKTGRSVKLGSRAAKLPESLYMKVAEQMSKCAAADDWLLANAEPDAPHSRGRLEDILRTTFENILPKHGFALREKQVELAQEILDAFCGQKVSLCEAEVGTGKTYAYLLPAAFIRRGRGNSGKIDTMLGQNGTQKPIVIATSSIALQRALERDYIPTLSDFLMEDGIIKTPLTSALRKGKGNYICERRLANFAVHANAKTKAIVLPIFNGSVVDLASVKDLSPYIKRNICVDKNCSGDCPKHGRCRYTRYLAEVRRNGYDFQICNHNYLLADIIHRSKGIKPLLPDYQAIIIDEGHKFLDVARSMYGTLLSLTELCGIVKDIREITFAPGQSTAGIIRETDRILSKSQLLFQLLNNEVPDDLDDDEESERFATKIRKKTENLIHALKGNIDALLTMMESRSVIIRYAHQFSAAKRKITRINEALDTFTRHEESVYWLEQAESSSTNADFRLNALHSIPKNLGERLHRDLWSMKIPIIITSGTLSAAGSFVHIKKKTGINLVPLRRLSETTKPSPFDYVRNTLLYISENTPRPDNKDVGHIDAIADEVEKLVKASHGHAVVLFTSYKAMDMVWERIKNRSIQFPLFRLDRGGASVIERFKRSGNGVLFASGALWEGIDISGDVLSMLIIVRLPFAVPDPVSEWEKTLFDNIEDYIECVVVPDMLVKLKQGFGRLIRSETDTGCCAILDSRVNLRGPYRDKVLAALPECGVTSNIGDIWRFMCEMKAPAYFK